MPVREPVPQPNSPLDGYLTLFLACLERLPGGFSPTTDGERVAAECRAVPAFVEALFISSRTRGLIEPVRLPGSRGRYRWTVSKRGAVWLAARPPAPTAE